MKRIFLQSIICILLFISLSVNNSFAQATEKIHHLEYFFDTDPGFGQATQVTVAASAVNISNLNFTPNIAALPRGLHTLHVRAVDSIYRRSVTTSQLFYKETVTANTISNVVAAEYFFDTDPGFGLATMATVTAGQTVGFNFAGNISSLTNGLHNLFVRTFDATGKWSISSPQLFYKQAATTNPVVNITEAEYFFDTDPGFGAATSATITSGQTVTFSFTGSIASLSNGLHNLFVRTKDANGKWSLSTPQLFYKQAVINNSIPNITSAEYFFDTDPGFGNATTASVTAGQTIAFNFAGNISSLTNGLHNLFVRTKDANGNWSLSVPQLFYKEAVINNPIPNITSAEYFFDTDPGFGAATAATVTAGQTITFNFAGNITSLTNGLHNLFVRTRDVNGKWSLSTPQLFYKEAVLNNPVPNITSAEYFFDMDPGFGNATAAVVTAGQNINFNFSGNITALTNGLHYLYVRTRDANGKWNLSTPQLFYKEPVINNPIPNIVAAEYYVDSDPGVGSGTAFTVSPQAQTIIQNFNFAATLLQRGLHRLYIRVKDANGKWSLTNTHLFYYETVLPVPPTDQFVKLEWFWNNDPGFGNANNVAVPGGNNGQLTNFAFSVPVPNSFSSTKQNLFIRVLDDWSLTTVRMVDFTNIVLPVTLLEFSAKAQENSVLTKWITTQEINSDYFEVEHSTDGIHFIKIGKVSAKGQSNTLANYEFLHTNPANGANYYRLKQVDKNGAYEYSAIVKILFNAKGTIVTYPNPVKDNLNITVAQPILQNTRLLLQFYDTKGVMVIQKSITERVNLVNMIQLATGNYSMRIVNEKGEIIDTRIIVKQ